MRDANNLSWKLVEVLEARAGLELLATYEAERRPHAQATIDLSVRLGSVVMTTSPARARARDLVVRGLSRFGPSRRFLEEMRFFPRQRYADGLVAPDGDRHGLVGRALPQPRVLGPGGHVAPLDEVLGDGFALLAVDVPGPAIPDGELWRRMAPGLVRVVLDDRFPAAGEPPTVADFDGGLREVLASAAGKYVLVRPDRYVAAVFAGARAAGIDQRLAPAWGRPRPVPDTAAA
jgi:3-(3-hydroxy-phenyl)propionate hydroxylase